MIYSIGHGIKKLDQLTDELAFYAITYLIDVRTHPYSRHNPQFNAPTLKIDLERVGITYVAMGDTLGGLPTDPSCYTDGKVNYDVIKGKTFFIKGINRLIVAYQKNLNIAIMCSESKPEECHRSKLIGQELRERGIPLVHIVSDKTTRSQNDVMNRLTKGKGTIDLFGAMPSFTSRNTY